MKIAKEEENYIEVLFEGEDRGFPNLLKDTLIENKNVEFAACIVEHPLLTPPKLILRTKNKKPIQVLKEAAEKLEKQISQFKAKFEKSILLKEKGKK